MIATKILISILGAAVVSWPVIWLLSQIFDRIRGWKLILVLLICGALGGTAGWELAGLIPFPE